MKTIKQPASLSVLILLIIIILITSCENIKGKYPSFFEDKQSPIELYPKDQILIWKSPGISRERFKTIIDSLVGGDNSITVTYCYECDSSLAKLQGAIIAQGLGGSGQLASSGSGGGTGPSTPELTGQGGAEYFWSRNFYLNINDFVRENVERTGTNYSFDNTIKPVVVAVFDSGIDSLEVDSYSAIYDSPGSCIASADKGWNFPNANPNVSDEYFSPHGHGANVTSILLKKAATINQTPIKILPVKFIKDENTIPKLNDVLCGLAYAANRGANIVNASFGYYLPKDQMDSATILFKEYIKYYTNSKDHKMIIVAAAGNKDDVWQNRVCSLVTRNLDSAGFFPASFAADTSMPNIIAVTTVANRKNELMVSPNQNYSMHVVDIGVYADDIDRNNSDRFMIRSPRLNNSLIEGSSFAAPVMTGLIAAYYDKIKEMSGSEFNTRKFILPFLNEAGVIMPTENLSKQIRFGLITN